MLTLGIETSDTTGSVALTQGDVLLEERSLSKSGRRHAQSLVAEIDALFKTHHFTAHDCNIVAVSIGPGSFTGLRVGLVCAKTFAYATRCKLVAVDTFLAIAHNAPQQHDALTIIANAQRKEIFVGQYRRDETGWFTAFSEIEIVNAEQFMQTCAHNVCLTGPGVKLLEATGWQHACVIAEEERSPRAAKIARLGKHAIEQGDETDLWSVVPRYLRLSAAEEKANRTRVTN